MALGSGTSGDLRYCITEANLSSNNTIDFSVPGTIQLTKALPALSANVTVMGPGSTSLSIDGGGTGSNFSVLTINKGVTATDPRPDPLRRAHHSRRRWHR